MSKCDKCRWGIANVGLDVQCPPCHAYDGFEPVDMMQKVKDFLEAEADALDECGMNHDADKFREFLATLDPCA